MAKKMETTMLFRVCRSVTRTTYSLGYPTNEGEIRFFSCTELGLPVVLEGICKGCEIECWKRAGHLRLCTYISMTDLGAWCCGIML